MCDTMRFARAQRDCGHPDTADASWIAGTEREFRVACDVKIGYDPYVGKLSPTGLCTADASAAMRPVNGCFNAKLPHSFNLSASFPNPYCPPAFKEQANWSAFEITGSIWFASSGGGEQTLKVGTCVMTTVCVSTAAQLALTLQ